MHDCMTEAMDFEALMLLLTRMQVTWPGETVCAQASAQMPFEDQQNVWVAVRPEKISISKIPTIDADKTTLKGTVWDIGYYGNLSIYRVKTSTGKIIQVSTQNRQRLAERAIEWEEEVFLSWDPSSAIVIAE